MSAEEEKALKKTAWTTGIVAAFLGSALTISVLLFTAGVWKGRIEVTIATNEKARIDNDSDFAKRIAVQQENINYLNNVAFYLQDHTGHWYKK